MITATAWVPRGFAAQFPTRKEFDEEEFERIAGLARGQLDDAREELAAEQNGEGDEGEGKDMEMEMEVDENEDEDGDEDEDGGVKVTEKTKEGKEKEKEKGERGRAKKKVDDDDLREYDLDNYDNEDEDDAAVSDEGEPMGMFNSVKSLAYHQNGEDDPYITLKEDDDEEEKEELQVLATDNLLLVAKTEDEVAQLEVYVYEDEADNFYVHHDIMLPAIPLCVEWLDVPVHQAGPNKPIPPLLDKDSRGSFCAIGTMDPDIEIWDLDVVDCMFPNAILGAGGAEITTDAPKKKKKKKEKKKSKKANDTHHVDSVLALAANRAHRNLLASASADKTVKLWDLNTTTCAKSYSHHTDKVCALAWHPRETSVLLSGSYDRTVVAADMRAPEAKAPKWGVESDVEGIQWDPHDPNYFYISTESGMVHLHDTRNAPSKPAATAPVWTLQAHDRACSAMDVNPVIPGFIATGGFDKQVKLWNIAPGGGGPSLVINRNLDLGRVFSVGFGPDKAVGFRLAVAGSNGVVQVWDTSTNAAVRRVFAGRVPEVPEGKEERMIRVQDDNEESDDDEGEEGGNERDGWESMDE